MDPFRAADAPCCGGVRAQSGVRALSTGRFQRLTRNLAAIQRAELGRKTENLNRLQLENEGLREELRCTEQNRVAKANEAGELRRVVAQNECTLAEIRSALKATREQLVEERSKFASFQDQLADRVRQGAAEISRERLIGRQLQQDLQRWLLSAAPTATPRSGFNHT